MNRIRILLLLLLTSVPVAAQETMLFIERIDVRNNENVSREVVLAESRLSEHHEYSEDQLRDAAARLSRLPFLLSVEFSLEKGSERGDYVLVIEVRETRTFFYNLDLRAFGYRGDSFIDADNSDHLNRSENGGGALGFRWFVGHRGSFHIGMASSGGGHEFIRQYLSVQAGYTRYDVFGTRAFVTFNLRRPIELLDGAAIVPQIVAGIPLSPNQTLTLKADELRFDTDDAAVQFADERTRRSSQRTLSARWSYNTTNDPLVPTLGTVYYAEPLVAWSHATTGERSYHARTLSLAAGAAHYWELSDRDSVSADVRAELASDVLRVYRNSVEHDDDAHYGSVGVGYSHSLWTVEERANGDSRFELMLRYANRSRPYDATFNSGNDVRQVSASWLRRSSWGTLRLGGGYAW